MNSSWPTEEPPEIITDPTRICKIIQHTYQQRALLTALFPDKTSRSEKGNCTIVNIDKGEKELLVNKLFPEPAHTHFIKERNITLTSLLNGVEIAFKAELKSLVKEKNDTYYLVKFPDKVFYHQKRGAHRADMKHHDPIPISISLNDTSHLNGIIYNISYGGLAISFEHHLPLSLQVNKTLAYCNFTIPESQNVVCELNIRFIQHIHEKTAPKIGVKFGKISKDDHKKITQFVMKLDRLKRRRSFQ